MERTRKCPFAGEKLEAATGVEPVMEVLRIPDHHRRATCSLFAQRAD